MDSQPFPRCTRTLMQPLYKTFIKIDNFGKVTFTIILIRMMKTVTTIADLVLFIAIFSLFKDSTETVINCCCSAFYMHIKTEAIIKIKNCENKSNHNQTLTACDQVRLHSRKHDDHKIFRFKRFILFTIYDKKIRFGSAIQSHL